ncbi:MAG: DEAD/DEAH box helicase [Anaerolineales bacterium]
MTTEFESLNLRPELLQAITERGYVTPSPIQAAMIPVMLTGVDVIGQAQTGTGKTAAFSLPILQKLETGRSLPQALVLAPTRELALQVANAMYEYGKYRNVRVLAIYGGASYSRQMARLHKGVDVVVGTPGRVLDLLNQKVLDLSEIRTVVLDEADEMLSMGFIEDVEAILAATPAERQTALFSATLPPRIRTLSERTMRDPQSIRIQQEQVTVAAIEQRFYLVNEADKLAALTRLFEVEEITSALIFARTRASASDLANELTVRGFPSETLNGDLSQEARERTLNRFRQNQIKVLVATDVAARGLDIDDISHVFNFDLPEDPEIYVHRIGRTGRAGKTGIAISLITPREKRRQRDIEAFTRQKLTRAELPSEEDIIAHRESQVTNRLKVWLNRGRYRREMEMVQQLVAEGHDPLELAAAALKMARGEEKIRPIAPVQPVVTERPPRILEHEHRPAAFRRDRAERGERPERFGRDPRPGRFPRRAREIETISHEPGMVRLSLSMGRSQGIRPKDVVGTIAFHADIPGSVIGKIFIEDHATYVDVPETMVGKVLSKNGEYRFNREVLIVKKA